MIKNNYYKGMIIIMGTWISYGLGLLMPLMGLLCALMIVDYISGLLAAKKEAIDNPTNRRFGLSSKKSIVGIYKKIGYMLTIFVAFCIDYIICKFATEIGISADANTVFGLMTVIWFSVNECISILENVNRMGVKLPVFINKVLADIHEEIEENTIK